MSNKKGDQKETERRQGEHSDQQERRQDRRQRKREGRQGDASPFVSFFFLSPFLLVKDCGHTSSELGGARQEGRRKETKGRQGGHTNHHKTGQGTQKGDKAETMTKGGHSDHQQ